MRFVCVVNEDGPEPVISIEESSDPDAVSLSKAFRLAKIAAGWEVRVKARNWHYGSPPRGEPVCRNLRGEHGDFVARARQRST